MKKLLLGTAMSLAVVAGASAADLPVKAPELYVKAPPPVWSWTGFYGGGNIGYSWGTGKSTYYDPNFGISGLGAPSANSVSEKLDGVIGGGQIGYNWQVNSVWVLGIEADIQGSGERGSGGFSDPYSVGTQCDIYCSTVSGSITSAIDWFGTVRGRIGVLATPTLLIFGTGGLAYGGVSSSGTITDACGIGGGPGGTHCAPLSWGFSSSATHVGWSLGGGVEGVVASAPNWTWKLEYLYLDLGKVSGTGLEPFADFGPLPYTWSTRITDNIFRVGLNYKLSH
ncbi:MAG: outer membrane protein [Xanthobacteraceae bacterium]